jgi:photosystem II stability/assembly factor-like uncharacterized protein
MKTILSILLVTLLGLVTIQSQEYLELILEPQENTTLQDIKTLAEDYFETSDKGRGSGYKQYKRWEYIMERKVNADGRILNFSQLSWEVINELNSQNPPVGRSSGTWTSMGPTSYVNGQSGYNGGLGRVNVIAFHPTNANTIYIGVPSGGVWKTTDGGANWTPIADILGSIGVSGIVVDHTSPNTVYIFTGDGDGANTYSIGVLKSTDGGTTWATTGLSFSVTNFVRGFKLLMDPNNSNIMYATTNIGILKTTNGWSSWSNILGGSFRDIEFKPGTPTTLYATTADNFYRSTNSGTNWSLVTSGLPTLEDRAELAVSPANSNYVYYLAGPAGSNSFKGLYRSTDSGITFSTMATTPNILGYSTTGNDSNSQSWYDLAIAVNPGNANNTITGGVNVWRSMNGGATNTCITNWFEPPGTFEYVHADIHELVYNQLDNKLYCGSDGGISVSTDHGVTWTPIWNGLQIMQFYRIAGVEANQNLLLGGTQDNGTNKYTGSTTIQHILGADGMDCMIDYNNNNNMFYTIQFGNLQRSTDGGSTSAGIQPPGSTGAWVTPIGMDPNNPSIIYGGYDDVYRSTNSGNSWTNLGSDGRGAFAVGINNPARLYAAVNNTIQTSSNTGGSWNNITGGWPNLTITYIAVDPANANRVWITLGGYTSGQKVYESTNAGASWTNISGSLPNLPALSIVYENTGGTPMDALYVGMDVGVYYGSDVTPWTILGTGLPNAPIFDLEINHTNSKIRAGTFGRGFWETALYNVDNTDPVAICQNITVQLDINGTVTIQATDVDNGSTDNIGIVSYSIDVDTFTCSDVGNPVTVTLTVMDAAGNSDSCTAIVTVEDNIDPNAICQDITLQLDASGNASITPSQVDNGSTDACGIATLALDISTFDCSDVGANTVTLLVTDVNSNGNTCTATITVEDNVPPVAICQDLTVQLDANGFGFINAAQVDNGSSDACGIATVNVTPNTFDCNDIGANTVTLIVTDVNGNSSNCNATITVEDNLDPVALCQDITVMLDINGNATIAATDVDNGSNDACGIMSLDVFPDTFDTGDIGPNNVTLTVTDNNGNVSTCNAVVTVIDYLNIDENDFEKGVILYPNPAGNQISIKIPIESKLNISVFDLIGKLVYQKYDLLLNDTHTIDVSYFNKGMYFIEIRSEYGSVTKKLIKK